VRWVGGGGVALGGDWNADETHFAHVLHQDILGEGMVAVDGRRRWERGREFAKAAAVALMLWCTSLRPNVDEARRRARSRGGGRVAQGGEHDGAGERGAR